MNQFCGSSNMAHFRQLPKGDPPFPLSSQRSPPNQSCKNPTRVVYIPRFCCLGPHFWWLKSLVPWLYIPNNVYIYISHLINPHLIPKYPQSDPCIITMNLGGSNGTYTALPALPAPPPTSSALLHRGPPEVPLPVQNPSLLWLGKNPQLVT